MLYKMTDATDEIFIKLKYNDTYEISNLGRLRRMLKTTGEYKILKGTVNTCHGYVVSNFKNNITKKICNKAHHILVAEHFLTKTHPKDEVDHIDRDKHNNKLSNLRYVTRKQNARNTSTFVSSITETDIKKRRHLLYKRRKDNPDEVKRRRQLGQGSILKIKDNKYLTMLCYKGKKYRKVINGKYEEANKYLSNISGLLKKHF